MATTNPKSFSSGGSAANDSLFDSNLKQRYRLDAIFRALTWIATSIGLIVLAILIIDTCIDALPRLNLDFLTSFPSRRAERAGVASALAGTVWLLLITAAFAFPIGVGTGIYLQEFAKDNWFTRMVEINISNLAAVPSIIYGLLGLTVFVQALRPITNGRSLLAAGLTLALLILPVIIVATREALKAVPDGLRLAGMALGSTRWQTVWHHILPLAFPGILTGTILALSRAIGETAPLIVIGAQTFVAFLPNGPFSSFSALPIQIFNWTSRPQEAFHANAAAGSIVLLVVLLLMNATAIYLRNRFQKER
ncbi:MULTISPECIES: phosphate ABC transporter permease PstA [unclassified Leptolyngbya]|uniref:phosphate ABC transporter permease PstA n=1 Tax=unclassified Leptolyngbya TaxID=2650499 RepID=UPI0016835514|nr:MULTISPECIES: phosphate ABC transporter permease PstA [unclassified Leptolyngbya]MBD1914135.1 phosphate ABC transporter permease PstA [Leptolyngbya sp. FACHB-8]MBD2155915.1 phosphate ABC transporter permease PstA [Leptolyngbya sp. FACHB-16]